MTWFFLCWGSTTLLLCREDLFLFSTPFVILRTSCRMNLDTFYMLKYPVIRQKHALYYCEMLDFVIYPKYLKSLISYFQTKLHRLTLQSSLVHLVCIPIYFYIFIIQKYITNLLSHYYLLIHDFLFFADCFVERQEIETIKKISTYCPHKKDNVRYNYIFSISWMCRTI